MRRIQRPGCCWTKVCQARKAVAVSNADATAWGACGMEHGSRQGFRSSLSKHLRSLARLALHSCQAYTDIYIYMYVHTHTHMAVAIDIGFLWWVLQNGSDQVVAPPSAATAPAISSASSPPAWQDLTQLPLGCFKRGIVRELPRALH